MDEKKNEIAEQENKELSRTEISEATIQNLIYNIRGQQVMLDSDLAILYQVETRNLNKAMKRNLNRFPEDFCFQLTKEEYENLMFQIGTSRLAENGHGGRRKLPYAFTEQGISMLSAILRSETAVNVSIGIMRAFVQMRRFLANNALMFERINEIESKHLEYQKNTNEKFDKIFDYISEHEESKQTVFFDGQIYDAFSFLTNLVEKAEKRIVLIDNYVDVGTLNILAKKKGNVDVCIYTLQRTRMTAKDVEKFNEQYPTLVVKCTGVFHDRFMILDETKAYHIGASIKDAGKKCFSINKIEDDRIVKDILARLRLESDQVEN